jgi:hypothetical protein
VAAAEEMLVVVAVVQVDTQLQQGYQALIIPLKTL